MLEGKRRPLGSARHLPLEGSDRILSGRTSCTWVPSEGGHAVDANSIIAGWKKRLIALADNPPYVFRDTPQYLIDQHSRQLTSFVGYSESEVASAEERLGVQFPEVFRAYLLEMAKSPGDLFRGSDLAGIEDFEQFRTIALKLMADTDPRLTLPGDAVVFLIHQGYTFVYLRARGGFDEPPMYYKETESETHQAAPTFAEMVDNELTLMESVDNEFHKNGGYYMTLHPDGGESQIHPARNSGERPLDQS